MLESIMIVMFAIAIIGETLLIYFMDTEKRYWMHESQMLWQLLSDQAKLHQMSLDAYIAMLQEAQRHTIG